MNSDKNIGQSATKPTMLHNVVQLLSIALRILGTLAAVLALISLAITLTHSWETVMQQAPSLFGHGNTKPLQKQIGSFAEFAAIGAAGFWLLKIALTQIKKRKIALGAPLLSLLQNALKLLKKNHRFLGWITAILGTGHAIYFLLYPDSKIKYTYTGIGALCGLAIVVGAGVFYHFQLKRKKPVRSDRLLHIAAALLFGLLLLIHLYV
jgi:hypothetical protein